MFSFNVWLSEIVSLSSYTLLLLRPVPTTNGGDGYVHFGDMLTLRSVGVSKISKISGVLLINGHIKQACTRGLLQVDAAETQAPWPLKHLLTGG